MLIAVIVPPAPIVAVAVAQPVHICSHRFELGRGGAALGGGVVDVRGVNVEDARVIELRVDGVVERHDAHVDLVRVRVKS